MDRVRERAPARLLCVVARLASFALGSCTANDDIHSPMIGSLAPDHGPPGTIVSISGSYFCAQPEPEDPDDVDPLECDHIGAVTFGTRGANIDQYTDLLIAAEVPDLTPGDALVFVTVLGRTSNSATFSVEPAP